MLEHRVLLSGQSVVAGAFTTVPGTPLEDVELQFELSRGGESFQEMGVFLFDANGTVDGLSPGSEGFTDAVLNRTQVVFGPDSPPGQRAGLSLTGGDQVGVYFRQNAATETSADRFNVSAIADRMLRLSFEENASIWPSASNSSGSHSRQFDDAAIQVTFGDPVPFAPPTLAPIEDATIPEEELFELTAIGQNPEGPDSDLRYRLDMAPAGATIDEMTGEFLWTPSETQGPGRYDVVVTVFNVTRPAATATQRFTIDVNEVNTAPVIDSIPDSEVNQLEELTLDITATDADRPIIPANRFTFSLVDNPVSGASIDPETGVFTWTPTADDGPGTFLFEVRVVDNGSPQLEDTEIFTVRVNEAVGDG